jgi:hypothetical protein
VRRTTDPEVLRERAIGHTQGLVAAVADLCAAAPALRPPAELA